MKKLIAIILTLSMLASLFALSSCDSPSESEEKPSESATEGEHTPESDGNATEKPTEAPMEAPTEKPTEKPTEAPTEAPTEKPTEKPTEDGGSDEPEEEKTYRVLFIGNSFTFYNDMPDIFEDICVAAGIDVEVETVTNGGHRLDEFADTSDDYGSIVFDKLMSDTEYDYVILQEQSGRPIAKPASFYDGARDLAELVYTNGAELWFYQTWGYKEGYSKLPDHGGTTKEMELLLRAAYNAIADELGASVAHVGVAMYDLYCNESFTPDLYNSDKFHPSKHGSVLAAMTIAASIFEIDPTELEVSCGISEEELDLIKEAAYFAAFAPEPIPDGYKVSSEGVTNKE